MRRPADGFERRSNEDRGGHGDFVRSVVGTARVFLSSLQEDSRCVRRPHQNAIEDGPHRFALIVPGLGGGARSPSHTFLYPSQTPPWFALVPRFVQLSFLRSLDLSILLRLDSSPTFARPLAALYLYPSSPYLGYVVHGYNIHRHLLFSLLPRTREG